MRTITFSTEMGVNPSFDCKNNSNISMTAEEVGCVVQTLSEEVLQETGVYITAIVSGPNRSCYKAEWGCPKGGEITYQIRGNSDHRLQFRDKPYESVEWKRAVLLFLYKMKKHFGQEYILVEFTGSDGVDSYVIGPDTLFEDLLINTVN